MMRLLWLALLAWTLLLYGSQARADAGPLLGPTKDVAVTYSLNGATQQNGAEKLELTYADHGRVRMDFFQYPESSNPLGSVIFDPPSNRVISVLPERHGYLQRDVSGLVNPGLFGLNAKMQFSRKGNATIAGQSCADWSVLNGTAAAGTVCVTDDGVILRVTREKPTPGSIEAVAVHYAPPLAGVFAPPTGYTLIPSASSPGGPPTTGRSATPSAPAK